MTSYSKEKAIRWLINQVVPAGIGGGLTSHEIAKIVGCTAAYARRVLIKMYDAGEVGCSMRPYRGVSRCVFRYVPIEFARKFPAVYYFTEAL